MAVIVRLRQEGKLVATLEVLEHGALVIRMGGKELELSVRDSRRLAGAIIKKSVSGTFGRAMRKRLGARRRMSELAGDRPKTPKPPGLGLIVAVLLELCIVATFTVHHSFVGLALCAAYAWFSASWSFFRGPPSD